MSISVKVDMNPDDLLPFIDLEVDNTVAAAAAPAGGSSGALPDQDIRPIIKRESESTELLLLAEMEVYLYAGYLLSEQVEEEDRRFEVLPQRGRAISGFDGVPCRWPVAVDPAGVVCRISDEGVYVAWCSMS